MMITVASPEEMEKLGGRIAAMLKPGDCVFLMGDLGVGKSVLARAIARALGVEGAMPSPIVPAMDDIIAICPGCSL